MKSSGPLKHFIIAFVIALVIYVVFYNFIEHRRSRNGPWRVTFTNEAGVPELIVLEPELSVTNCRITFPGESAADKYGTLVFAQPQPVPFDVPFGKCVFEDTTFQPGTIVFQFFGHEIQLLPRALTIDRQEYPWQSDKTFTVNKANTSPAAP
jgi:hypothetical protein